MSWRYITSLVLMFFGMMKKHKLKPDIFWFFYLLNRLYVYYKYCISRKDMVKGQYFRKVCKWNNIATNMYIQHNITRSDTNILSLSSYLCIFCTVKLSGVYLPILNLDLPFYHTRRCTFLMKYIASHHHQCHNLYYPRFFPSFLGLARSVQR